MDKALEYVIQNKGILKDARAYFLKSMEDFPTYDLLSKEYFKNNPQLIQTIKNVSKAK